MVICKQFHCAQIFLNHYSLRVFYHVLIRRRQLKHNTMLSITWHMQIMHKAHIELYVQSSSWLGQNFNWSQRRLACGRVQTLYMQLYVSFAYDLHMPCHLDPRFDQLVYRVNFHQNYNLEWFGMNSECNKYYTRDFLQSQHSEAGALDGSSSDSTCPVLENLSHVTQITY